VELRDDSDVSVLDSSTTTLRDCSFGDDSDAGSDF
jgi:hypothetical protein